MLHAYPGCFFQKKDGTYCVVFPDLGNISAFGDDFDSTLASAVDVLAKHIFNAKLNDDELPPPSDMHMLKPSYDEMLYTRAFINVVSVDAEEYAKTHFERAVKKTLTIPQWLNESAVAQNVNFSKVLQNALINELNLNRK